MAISQRIMDACQELVGAVQDDAPRLHVRLTARLAQFNVARQKEGKPPLTAGQWFMDSLMSSVIGEELAAKVDEVNSQIQQRMEQELKAAYIHAEDELKAEL